MYNKNLIILFFTLVVMMMGFGLIIPILPFYVESFGAGGSALGMLMAIFSLMQLIFSPFWGGLSDRIGRKRVLVVGVFGFGLSMLFFGMSTSLWMLYASRALGGILSSATFPTAMAYIGDSTSEENRGGGMGVIGAAMGFGMVLGPGIGGWLGDLSLTTPFFFSAGLAGIAMVLILIFLPESLPEEARSREAGFQGPQFNKMWDSLFGPLGFLFFLAFLLSFGLASFEGIFGIFAAHRYAYGPAQVGTLLVIIGSVSAVVQGALTGPATKHLGEETVIKLSLISSAVGFWIMLLANNYLTVVLTITLFMISNAMLRPAVSSMISRRAESGQGIALGLNNSFMSLGRTFGPLLAGILFDSDILYPYISGGFIMLVGFVLSLFLLHTQVKTIKVAPLPFPKK